jgi:hypothetical protein
MPARQLFRPKRERDRICDGSDECEREQRLGGCAIRIAELAALSGDGKSDCISDDFSKGLPDDLPN